MGILTGRVLLAECNHDQGDLERLRTRGAEGGALWGSAGWVMGQEVVLGAEVGVPQVPAGRECTGSCGRVRSVEQSVLGLLQQETVTGEA